MNGAPDRARGRAQHQARKLAHLLLVVGGWVGFVWMWSLVASRPWDSQRLVWLIVGSCVVIPLLTGGWVLHNRALARRKGERRSVAVADMRYEHDWHGRRVHAEWAALRGSRLVLVQVEGEHKRYHGLRADAPRDVATAPLPDPLPVPAPTPTPTRSGRLRNAPSR